MKGKTAKLERIARNDPNPAHRRAATDELHARAFRHRHRAAPSAPDTTAPRPSCTAPDRTLQHAHAHAPTKPAAPNAATAPARTPTPRPPLVFQRAANAPVTGQEPVNGYTVHVADDIIGLVWRDPSNRWRKAAADIIVAGFDQLTSDTYPTRKAAAEALFDTRQ